MRFLAAAVLLSPGVADPQEDPSGRIRALVGMLGADRVEDREAAERGLKEAGAPAVPELEKAAADGDREVAERARRALRAIDARLRLTPAVKKALPGIEDRLAEGGDPAWTRAFLEANSGFDDGRPRFRDEDLDSLSGPAVRGARDRDEKWAVCRVAARRGCRSAIPEIIRLLDDPEGCVNGILALRRLEAREAVPALLRLLAHEDVLTCRNAVDALGELRAGEALGAISRLTRHPDGYMRLDAAKALKDIGRAEAVPHLLPLVEDPEACVRSTAISALAALGAKEAVHPIVLRLDDERLDVRREAVAALRQIGARETAPQLVRLLRDEDPGVFLLAGEILVRWRAREVVPRVVEALEDANERIRETALGTLAGLGDREAAPGIARAAGRADALTRRAALRALGWLGSKDRREEILGGLRDGDGSVREAAVAALGDMGVREAAPRIIGLLEDLDGTVRARAASVLAALDASEAVPRIVPLLQDEKGDVRRSAAEALCVLGSREGVRVLLEQAELSSGPGFFALNALRRPESWRRLGSLPPWDRLREGPGADLLELVARRSGLGVAFEGPEAGERKPWACFWFPPWEGPSGGADALRKGLGGTGCDIILETDRIRVVPSAVAVAFWKEWWETERIRK